jgi:hypothetical protein
MRQGSARAPTGIAALLILAATVAATHAVAAKPLDLLFSTPHMERVGPEARLGYRHSREAAPGTRIGPDFSNRIALETGAAGEDGAMAVEIVMDADGAARRLETFRGVPGNPMLMVFLETAVEAVARATGGSPFYLRNRIKEAMRDDLSARPMVLRVGAARLPARALEIRPFEGDANAEALGAFEGLAMRFVVAEGAPGMIVAMTAITEATVGEGENARPLYVEEIRLDPAN